MTDSQPTTARTTLTERAEQRTLAKRRRRVWRNLLFFVVVTLAIVVLTLLNRDEQAIRSELRRALDATKGCVVEIIMKDNHTIGGRPENVIQWCRIAKEEAQR